MKIVYDALGALLTSLSPERKSIVIEVTGLLVDLDLPQDAADAIIAAIILETAEVQFIKDGGTVPPVRNSTLDLLKPIFDSKRSKEAKASN